VSSRRSARRVPWGMTLVELLVAVCLASLLLMGAWPWCWTMVQASHQTAQRAEAESSLAFAGRLFTSEARRAVALGDGAGGGCGSSSVTLQTFDAVTGQTQAVTYRYDPARRVLWRKASGSYVAERLSSCDFTYFGADGSQILPGSGGALSVDDLYSVRSLGLRLVIEGDDRPCVREWIVALRVWGR